MRRGARRQYLLLYSRSASSERNSSASAIYRSVGGSMLRSLSSESELAEGFVSEGSAIRITSPKVHI